MKCRFGAFSSQPNRCKHKKSRKDGYQTPDEALASSSVAGSRLTELFCPMVSRRDFTALAPLLPSLNCVHPIPDDQTAFRFPSLVGLIAAMILECRANTTTEALTEAPTNHCNRTRHRGHAEEDV